VADDDDSSRRQHSRILRGVGYSTMAAANAREVLGMLVSNPGAVVVTDYAMPAGDGLTLIDKARQIDPTVVFVMVTGMTTLDPDAVRSGRRSLFKVVFKPVDEVELVEVVNQAIAFQDTIKHPVGETTVEIPAASVEWPKKVVIIDANADSAKRVQGALSSLQPHIEVATSLSEGLNQLRGSQVDLVVFNVDTDSEGAAGLEKIRATEGDAAIVATAGLADDSAVHESLRRGAHEFVGKRQIDAISLRRAAFRARQRKLAEVDLLSAALPDPAEAKKLSLGDASQRRLEERLRKSVAEREFAIHLQAQIGLKSGDIEGAEALVRWTPKAGESAHPGIFIPILEDTGLIGKVGDQVFEMACERAAQWRAGPGFDGRISVNLSAQQFDDDDLVPRFCEVAEKYKVSPKQLELEITESMMLKNITRCEQMLRAFKDVGFTIALDDFGTGYSSLAYLHRLPVDVLKIDRSMVMALGTGKQVETICGAMIDLGSKLGLEVIAEGVETIEQMLFLQNAGAHKAQGFLMARPMPDLSPHVPLESLPKGQPALFEALQVPRQSRPTPTRLRAVPTMG